MSQNVNYFKIGAFTFAGLLLFVLGLFFFGLSGTLFKDNIECVTFFNRSVQGLNVDSAVKFRGFNVGTVSHISLASVAETSDQPMVQVNFEIDPKALSGSKDHIQQAEDFIIKQTHDGLKVYLTYQGITGMGFLDLDFTMRKDSDDQELHVGQKWAKERNLHYIPSGPGRIMEISRSVTEIVRSLRDVDFVAISTDLKKLLQTVEVSVSDLNTKRLSADLDTALKDITQVAEELTKVLRDVGQMVSGGEEGSIGKELEATMKQMRLTLKRLDQMFNSSRGNLPLTMDNLRVMSENLRELSELLKAQPSQAFFGKPPTPARPSSVGR